MCRRQILVSSAFRDNNSMYIYKTQCFLMSLGSNSFICMYISKISDTDVLLNRGTCLKFVSSDKKGLLIISTSIVHQCHRLLETNQTEICFHVSNASPINETHIFLQLYTYMYIARQQANQNSIVSCFTKYMTTNVRTRNGTETLHILLHETFFFIRTSP